jgi:hypothetical protein
LSAKNIQDGGEIFKMAVMAISGFPNLYRQAFMQEVCFEF